MSIHWDKKGRAVISLTDLEGERHRWYYRNCSPERAEELLEDHCRELGISNTEEQTLSEFKEKYLKWCEKQKGYRYKKNVVNLVCRRFGHLRFPKITTYLVEVWQGEAIRNGLKPATINRRLATLKHMFSKAYDWNRCSETDLKQIRKVKLLPENNRRTRFLDHEEYHRLIEATETSRNKQIKRIIILDVNTGLRKSELLGLEKDEVDLVKNIIKLSDSKNFEGRTIPLNDAAKQAIEEELKSQKVAYPNCPYVFHYKGEKIQDIRGAFNNAAARAKIKNFRFHDLRHTFASWLVMAGVPLLTVKELLGHKTIAMTLRYAHLAPQSLIAAVNLISLPITETKEVKQEAI